MYFLIYCSLLDFNSYKYFSSQNTFFPPHVTSYLCPISPFLLMTKFLKCVVFTILSHIVLLLGICVLLLVTYYSALFAVKKNENIWVSIFFLYNASFDTMGYSFFKLSLNWSPVFFFFQSLLWNSCFFPNPLSTCVLINTAFWALISL